MGRCTDQHQSWAGIQRHRPNVIRIHREGWLVLFIHLLCLSVCVSGGSATSRWGWKNHGHMYHKDEENNQGSHQGWMWGADRGFLEDDKEWFRMIQNSRGCDLSMCYSTFKIAFQTSDSEVGEEISTNRSLKHIKPIEFNYRSYCQPSGWSSFSWILQASRSVWCELITWGLFVCLIHVSCPRLPAQSLLLKKGPFGGLEWIFFCCCFADRIKMLPGANRHSKWTIFSTP